ncbi:MAG TPA: mannose-6-phosphate isomerase [Kineosporiaceae bacterium]|nr:mannose-6-phosphate isomerase [Kineosporiaceae bacterium]
MRPEPLLLPNNQFDHFYLGGDRIRALRGGPGGPQRPEEWIGSATTRFGQSRQGLSALPDGTLLRERVVADPVAWLGPEHTHRYGGYGVELLVKLIDAGQRLPVHLHPDRAFAREHLGLSHGKTEAWYVLDAEPGAVVGLGFREPMAPGQVAELIRDHDSARLVESVHHLAVRPGDAVLVPSGTAHFIGAGVLVLELQEPTDLSILLEWEGLTVDGERDGHLGLGFDTALQALDLRAWTRDDLDACVRRAEPAVAAGVQARAMQAVPGMVGVLPSGAEPYFRADQLAPAGGEIGVPAGFAVLLLVDGDATVGTTEAGAHQVRRGDALLIPWSAGDWTLEGDGVGLLARPPAPDAPEGR